jgi:hypothetical protein
MPWRYFLASGKRRGGNAATFAMSCLGVPLVLCQQCAMKQKTRQEARLSD